MIPIILLLLFISCAYCCCIVFFPTLQIANHPLLVRRIYSDEDVVRFARKLHPMGAFGFECTLDRVIEEMKSFNDFSIHRVSSQLLEMLAKAFWFVVLCYIIMP